MRRIDLGVDPRWTAAGLFLFVTGLGCEVWVLTHSATVPIWLSCLAPLLFGIGGGFLLGQWWETKKLRQQARMWADSQGMSPDEPEEMPRGPRHRGEPLPEQPERRTLGPEDYPDWTTYANRLDNHRNPPDESGGVSDSE